MTALYRCGRQAEALRVFARTRERLGDELGLDPTPALVDLERRILQHDPALAFDPARAGQVRAADPAPDDVGPRSTQIPPSPVPLPRTASRAASGTAVGRRNELDALVARWRSCAAGSRHLSVIRGEPGIGKTSLAGRFAADVHAEGAIVLWGRATPHGIVPFEPIVEALRNVLRTVSPDARRRAVEGRDALSLLVPDLATLVPGVQPGTVDPSTELYVLFETVAGLLDDESSQHPYVLVIDDLQWADALSVRLVDYVLRHERPGRLMVVATMRSTPEGADASLDETIAALARDGLSTTVSLTGLDREETAAILVEAGWDASHGDAVHEVTSGNPFFITELAARSPGGAIDELPPSITGMIGARLDRVGPAANQIAAAAAIAGPTVSLPVLAAVTELDGDELLESIDVLIAQRLLAEDGPTGRLVFPHALVRQAIQQRVGTIRRRDLHLRIAAALGAGDEISSTPGERAHHLFEAGDLAPRRERVGAAIAAGRYAMSVLAREEALLWVDRALALGPGSAVDLVGVRILETDAALALGDRDRAKTASDAAVVAARAAGDPADLARAAITASEAVAGVGFDFGGVDPRLVDLLEDSLAVVPRDEVELRVRLLLALCGALVQSGDHERQQSAAKEAVALADGASSAALVASAQIARRLAAWRRDELYERIDAARVALMASRRAGDRHLEFTALLYLTNDLLEAGRHDEAFATFDQLRALTHDVARVTYDVYVQFIDGTFALLRGHYADAERHGAEAISAGVAAHGMNAQQAYGAQLFGLAWDRGQLGELVPLIESVVEALPDLPVWKVALAAALFEAGRRDDSRRVYDAVLDDDGLHLPDDPLFFNGACFMVEIARAHGDRRGAAVLRAALEPYAGRISITGLGGLSIGPVRRFVGVACHVAGDLDAADRHLIGAAEEARALGAAPHVARALRDRARVLTDRDAPGDRELAGELAAEAADLAASLGMTLRGIADPAI
jgi:tetratricopeptide (TPR) repeat protein